MKITIEIDNVHAPDLLRFLADIHPDQKLTSSPDEADTRWAPLPEIPAKWAESVAAERERNPLILVSTNTGKNSPALFDAYTSPPKRWNHETQQWEDSTMGEVLASIPDDQPQAMNEFASGLLGVPAADPLKVAMDDPVERVKLTDLVRPEVGKVYRTRHGKMIEIKYFDGDSFEGFVDGNRKSRMHYNPEGHTVIDDGVNADPWDLVEEIADPVPVVVENQTAADRLYDEASRFHEGQEIFDAITRAHGDAMVEQTDRKMLPRLIPQPGKKYRTRNGGEFTCSRNPSINDYIEGSLPAGPFYYHQDGQPVAGLGPEWDCVEEITEPSLSQQAAADLRAALDDPEPVAVKEDPTQRDLPFPDGLPELPPLPEGKTRWVYRGKFEEFSIPVNDRTVFFRDGEEWWRCFRFSHAVHHIEAI